MTRLARSFPSHPRHSFAGTSNISVTLAVVSPCMVSNTLAKVANLVVATASVVSVNRIKLASNTVLSVTSATTSTLSHTAGVGRILSVTSATTVSLNKSIGRFIQVASPVVASISRGIGKMVGSVSIVTPLFILRPGVVVNNFDGGITAPLSATTLQQPSTTSITPGIFRASPAEGTIVVQFRTFVVSIIRRVIATQ